LHVSARGRACLAVKRPHRIIQLPRRLSSGNDVELVSGPRHRHERRAGCTAVRVLLRLLLEPGKPRRPRLRVESGDVDALELEPLAAVKRP
jgi:hypothetical protein